MIDLHTHTTASDGRTTPPQLVAAAADAGVTVLGVTDHDTLAGCEPAAAAARGTGLELVPGIEITAIQEDVDVHVLGYFVDVRSAALARFLAEQRRRRIDRIREMIDRLRRLGIPLDADAILRPALDDPSRAIGRPWIARALVAGGHVATSNEAFSRWLGRGQPAFVPRIAAAPADVFARIHEAGGIASLAHPGLLAHDAWIPGYANCGLDAIEAYYTEHDQAQTDRYLGLASRLRLAVSGGSDYHADGAHGGAGPGTTALPLDEFERLKSRVPR